MPPSDQQAQQAAAPSSAAVSASSPPPPPKYYWGDAPEPDEFYASQGVVNSQAYFDTPHGRLFTQRFLPVGHENSGLKGSVYLTHGYGSDSGWMFQKIAIAFAQWGYAAFCADLWGHGRSDGIQCYMGDLDKVASASLAFFSHTRKLPEYADLPAFLFGESMGGLVTLLMYFKSEPRDMWTGIIFSAPLFEIPDDMKPSRVRLFLYGLLFLGFADTWAAMPDNKLVGKAISDPGLLKIIAANPRRYTGRPRVGTMRELLRMTQYVQGRFQEVTVPFLAVHGTDDGVASPKGCEWFYERTSSEDKSMKLYPGMLHSLIQGEPEQNSKRVLADMREWIDERVRRYGGKQDL